MSTMPLRFGHRPPQTFVLYTSPSLSAHSSSSRGIRPAGKRSRHEILLLDLRGARLELLDIPVREDEAALEEGSLLARDPDHEMTSERRWFKKSIDHAASRRKSVVAHPCPWAARRARRRTHGRWASRSCPAGRSPRRGSASPQRGTPGS